MKLKFLDQEVECSRVVKGDRSLIIFDGDEEIMTISGIDDFGIYELEDGEFDISTSRIAELKQKLLDTDYVIIKIAEGVATQEEYADVIAQRQEWREEINRLEG